MAINKQIRLIDWTAGNCYLIHTLNYFNISVNGLEQT
jgi:hypothetical protein